MQQIETAPEVTLKISENDIKSFVENAIKENGLTPKHSTVGHTIKLLLALFENEGKMQKKELEKIFSLGDFMSAYRTALRMGVDLNSAKKTKFAGKTKSGGGLSTLVQITNMEELRKKILKYRQSKKGI